jgi:hypothetical protein
MRRGALVRLAVALALGAVAAIWAFGLTSHAPPRPTNIADDGDPGLIP